MAGKLGTGGWDGVARGGRAVGGRRCSEIPGRHNLSPRRTPFSHTRSPEMAQNRVCIVLPGKGLRTLIEEPRWSQRPERRRRVPPGGGAAWAQGLPSHLMDVPSGVSTHILDDIPPLKRREGSITASKRIQKKTGREGRRENVKEKQNALCTAHSIATDTRSRLAARAGLQDPRPYRSGAL